MTLTLTDAQLEYILSLMSLTYVEGQHDPKLQQETLQTIETQVPGFIVRNDYKFLLEKK